MGKDGNGERCLEKGGEARKKKTRLRSVSTEPGIKTGRKEGRKEALPPWNIFRGGRETKANVMQTNKQEERHFDFFFFFSFMLQ